MEGGDKCKRAYISLRSAMLTLHIIDLSDNMGVSGPTTHVVVTTPQPKHVPLAMLCLLVCNCLNHFNEFDLANLFLLVNYLFVKMYYFYEPPTGFYWPVGIQTLLVS